jgi:biopolymer transport protein ExbB/TolQ
MVIRMTLAEYHIAMIFSTINFKTPSTCNINGAWCCQRITALIYIKKRASSTLSNNENNQTTRQQCAKHQKSANVRRKSDNSTGREARPTKLQRPNVWSALKQCNREILQSHVERSRNEYRRSVNVLACETTK